MRYNIRIPKELKRKICKNCYKYLKPGANSRIRANTKQKTIIVKCLECGKLMRYPYKNKYK